MPAVQWLWSPEPSTPRSWTGLREKPPGTSPPSTAPAATTTACPRHPATVRSDAYRSRIRCRDCRRTNAGPSGVVIALRAGGGRGQQASIKRFAKFGLDLHEGKTADRVRAARRPAAEGTRPGQAGDVRLPELHAYLRGRPGTGASGCGGSGYPSGCAPSCTSSRRAHAAPPSARPRPGQMAGKRGARALRLLCRARQQQGGRQHAHHHRHLPPADPDAAVQAHRTG